MHTPPLTDATSAGALVSILLPESVTVYPSVGVTTVPLEPPGLTASKEVTVPERANEDEASFV